MSLKRKLIILFIFTLVIEIGLGIYILLEKNKALDLLTIKTTHSMEVTELNIELSTLFQQLSYYDEALTDIARNYVYITDPNLKNKYYDITEKINLTLEKINSRSNSDTRELFVLTSKTNNELQKKEEAAIALAEQGRKSDALALLDSNDYSKQKDILSSIIKKYYKFEGENINGSVENSLEELKILNKDISKIITLNAILVILLLLTTIFLVFVIYFFVYYYILKRIFSLSIVARAVSYGDKTKRSTDIGKDEIGQLAKDVNLMIDQSNFTNSEIDKQVIERTENLEKITRLITTRELKMKEMKKKIYDLEEEIKNLNKKS